MANVNGQPQNIEALNQRIASLEAQVERLVGLLEGRPVYGLEHDEVQHQLKGNLDPGQTDPVPIQNRKTAVVRPQVRTGTGFSVSKAVVPDEGPFSGKAISPRMGIKHIPTDVSAGPRRVGLHERTVRPSVARRFLTEGSRKRHKASDVKTLAIADNKGQESFSLRSDKLNKLKELAPLAKKAENFEKNSNNDTFLKFLANPNDYLANKFIGSSIKYPIKLGGEVRYDKVDLKAEANKKIEEYRLNDQELPFTEALEMVAEELEAKSEPLQEYYQNRGAEAEMISISSDLKNNKNQYKKDIRRARDQKAMELFTKGGYADILEKHRISPEGGKVTKSTVDGFSKVLEDKRRTLKNDKAKIQSKIDSLKWEWRFTSRFFQKEKNNKLAKDIAKLEQEKAGVKSELATIYSDIATIKLAKSDIDRIDIAERRMLDDI